MLEVEIHQIRVGRDGSAERCIILRPKDQEDRRLCPIIIGPNEASAIVAPSSEPAPSRPMTHDLLLKAIDRAWVGQCSTSTCAASTKRPFFADINVKIGEEEVVLDARAVRLHCPSGARSRSDLYFGRCFGAGQ